MPRSDPFAGIKLSEQATPSAAPKLDQQLFAPAKPTPPAPRSTRPNGIASRERPLARQSRDPTAASPPTLTSAETPVPLASPAPHPHTPVRLSKPASLVAPRFDLADEALYKASFVFTQREEEALEDLKVELKRELDAKVTKNDLMRAALHMLVEDYATHGPQSYASRKVRRRKR